MQLGFDRLIEAMDGIATDLDLPVVAQIGIGTYQPKNMEFHRHIDGKLFESMAEHAKLIVSHAGIGTVLTARRTNTPIVLFHRRAALGEHRNDHQLATVRQLKVRPGILVAQNEAELPDMIAQGLALQPDLPSAPDKNGELWQAVASFIDGGSV